MLFFAALIAGFLILRAVLPMNIRPVWKVLCSLAAIGAAFKFQILHHLAGPMFFAPDLPGWAILVSGWIYAVAFFYFFLLLGGEAVNLVLYLFRLVKGRRSDKARKAFWNRVHLILFGAAVLLATAGILLGTAVKPRIREIVVSGPANLRIALLADLHADRFTGEKTIRSVVERTNALKPDLIVIAGDFVDGRVEKIGPEIQGLRELKSPLGVYGVPGNHEYYSGYREWMRFLRGLGIVMLENESVVLPGNLVLAGVTDPAAAYSGEELPNPPKAFRKAPENAWRILLSHRPDSAREAAELGTALQLSGHTHGGMIFGIDRIVAMFNGGFVSGLYRVGNTLLYVSNGTGIWSGFPARLGAPSEITLIRVENQKSPDHSESAAQTVE